MPHRDKLADSRIVPTPSRQALGALFTSAIRKMTCVKWDAGAIPAASTFSVHASIADRRRQDTSKPPDCEGAASHKNRCDLRQGATANVGPHPTSATESATSLIAEYSDLAVVVTAWPELPEAVRAGIVAMVKATAEGDG
jgi:hypothetical protein